MKKTTKIICAVLIAFGIHAVPASAANVTVTLPTFTVTLNGVSMEQTYNQYPMLVYKDITYVPMTWADTRLLGLESSWTRQKGLSIEKADTIQDQKTAQSMYKPYTAKTANAKTYSATIASGKITVNKKSITNNQETYPLLVFRDVTYFPLTWRFAVNEFGWEYSFDQKKGLVIAPKTTTNGTTETEDLSIIGKKVVINGTGVHLRADASTSSASQGTAENGSEWIVLESKTVSEKVWYRVMSTDGTKNAWVASWLTKKSADTSVSTSTSNDTIANSTKTSLVGKTVAVTGTTVNLRSDTSTSSAVIGQTVKGDCYIVLAEKTVNNEIWYQVKTKSGAKAWIAGWLVTETKGDNTTTSTDTNNNNETYAIVGKQVVVGQNGVNLRKEPGTTSTSVGVVNQGTTFIVLSKQTVDGADWYQVKDNAGNKVWIASWLVSEKESTTNTTTATPLSVTSVQQQGNKTVVTMKHGKGNTYSTSKASATELVLLLKNNYLNTNDVVNTSYANTPLKYLSIQNAGSNTLKATFTLQKGSYCTVKENGENLIVTVYAQHASGEKGLTGKTIVLDPGHGGSDPGAIGKVLGVTDAEVGLTVSQKLKTLLEAQGATVIMTRNTDIRVALSDRPKIANQAEADLFISVHANSSTNTAPKGIQVYYYAPSSNANLYAQSYIRKELATKVSNGLQAATGTASVVKTANYAVLRENDRPSILVETGFLSNASEEALLGNDAYRQKLANGIYQGIVNYLNEY